MAGYLPNVPGVRIPYHRDGSLIKYVTTTGGGAFTPTGAWQTLSSGTANEINDGDTVGMALFNAGGDQYDPGAVIAIVFPQVVTITGHNLTCATPSNLPLGGLYWSTDTTDGIDGTWTYEAPAWSTLTTAGAYRSITSTNLVGVKGIQLRASGPGGTGGTWSVLDLALYGQWSPTTLAGWHPTLDQQISGYELDFGDVPLGTIANKQFRIKNGRSLIANSVVVSCTNGTTEFVNGLTFSLNGTTFTPTVTIPTIAAGAISPTIYVRRTVLAGQAPNILSIAPIDFVASSWT